MSLREQIFAAQDIEKELVDIPMWGVKVEVRSMNGKARAQFLKVAIDDDGSVNLVKVYPQILIATCYDPESGEPLFTDADADELNAKNIGALEKLALVAMRLSGLTENALESGKESS